MDFGGARIERQGYLKQQSRDRKTWCGGARWLGAGRLLRRAARGGRRRQFWFVIKEGCLYWYTNESESEYKGVLPLMSACS